MDKVILTVGADFTGMMQASRLSIGLALLWHYQALRDFFGDSPFYWLHHTDSFLKLAIASDRLRDLLVIACTGCSLNKYKAKDKKRNSLFVTPFNQAASLLVARGHQDPHLVELAASLPIIGAEIFKFIPRRNLIVHEVATRMAKLTGDIVSKVQQRFDGEQVAGVNANPPGDSAPSAADQDAHEREFRAGIEGSMKEIVDWYDLLIRASNVVFQVEYWSRTLAPKH